MKRIFYSLVALLLLVGQANAKQVDAVVAHQVALNFMYQNTKLQQIEITFSYTENSASGVADYYVFTINNNTGFVIISAEDAGHPIIGYSAESGFDIPSADSNPNFIFWMKKRKEEIEYMRSNALAADAEIAAEWIRYSANKVSVVPETMSVPHAPLCSTRWDQVKGGAVTYNSQCPGSPTKSMTGCVATTMAQIMKKWSYPPQGTGQHSYTENNYGTLSVNFATATYNWASMPNTSSNSEVAKIMYHCGVSVNMDYSPSGSGAGVSTYDGPDCAQNAFVNYFGYDPGIHVEFQDSLASISTWIQMLEAEFAAGRPVQYFGLGPSGGHSWVCDGNDANGLMHMNWGWGTATSNYDGYYAVTNLTPGTYNYNNYLGALLGIQPPIGTAVEATNNNAGFNIYPNPAISEVTVEGSAKSEKVHYSICNIMGAETKSGYIFSKGDAFSGIIQVNDISKGMYFLKIMDGEDLFIQKLTKQ